MRVSFLLVAGAVSLAAQSSDEAAALLRDVAATARTATGWRGQAARVTLLQSTDFETRRQEQLKLLYQGPTFARSESTSGGITTMHVCDGNRHWMYTDANPNGLQNPTHNIAICAFPLDEWPSLDSMLRSATVTGIDQIDFEGRPVQCKIVRGDYAAPEAGALTDTRTLCIEPTRKLILRYRLDRTGKGLTPANELHTSITTTFSALERNPDLMPGLFAIPQYTTPQVGGSGGPVGPGAAPPTGASPPLAPGVYRMGNGVTPPVITYRIEPEYSEEARKAHKQGTVLLSVEVTADGRAQNPKVLRALGFGLDEQAMASIRKWHFKPGMKDGQPVTVQVQIEVSFNLQ